MSTSRWRRKLDLLYLVFFITHVPVMLCVDLAQYYPATIRPQFTLDIKEFYVNTYRDRFFIAPPSWFQGLIFLELIYHLPISIWAVSALIRNDPLVPLHLLVFSVEVAVSTLVCTLEMLSWEGYSAEERKQLSALYMPYLGLAILMGTDMFLRLRSNLLMKSKTQ